MNYPLFFKNKGRHTAVVSFNKFIQVHQLDKVVRLTLGENVHMVDDCINHDEQISSEEFNEALHHYDNHMEQLLNKMEVQHG